MAMYSVLFFGDIVGKLGRKALTDRLKPLKEELSADVVVVNGENSAGGLGIDSSTAAEIYAAGADIITTGNHIWKKREIGDYLNAHSDKIIRPDNFPPGAPGKGLCVWQAEGFSLAVINLQGRVFMADLIDCPFQAADRILESEECKADIIFVDFHAEATSEKVAMGYHLDGRASVVVGTHTHVQTADNRLLPKGTAYITDVGMCGPAQSVIGVKHELIVERFLSARPTKFDLAKGPAVINAVLVSFDEESKKPQEITRIYETI